MKKKELIKKVLERQKEREQLKKILWKFEKDLMKTIDEYSPRERWHYCTFKCPMSQICKYENRYRVT